uniref:Thioredoxin domain-containing protein n=1 Tax=Mesocestoides corti TaxID=53468 RepID=A0A5K3FD50_MESCO
MSVYEIRQMASDSAFENTSICILLIDPFSESSRVIKEIGRELAIVDSTPTLKRFKFVWTVDERGLSSLAMTTLEAPNILIYMPGNESLILYTHHNLADTTVGISKQNFISFLEDAANGQIPHYGGRSWLTTVRRFVFDFCVGSLVGPYSPRVPSTVYDASVLHIGCFPPFSFENFFRTSPILALLTFGVPLGCLSCLAYCICCSPFDTMDDSSFDDDDVDAAALEARRARLLDRSVLDAKLGPTTYYDAVRARSIYKRLAEKNRLVDNDLEEPQSTSKESRKDL